MILNSLSLQNFRNYKKADFSFDSGATVVVGANASGKSNLTEAIYLLANGTGCHSNTDIQLIHFGDSFYHVRGMLSEGDRLQDLEVVVSLDGNQRLHKKYLVNKASKRRVDFAGHLSVVLFTPLDLDIPIGQPSNRRRFLDETIAAVDYAYRLALTTYLKALRQRNALLEQAALKGIRDDKLFIYWDELLIKNGQIITNKREELITYINNRQKDLFKFTCVYDKSVISTERLRQYGQAELGVGATLVGPQRDDVFIYATAENPQSRNDVKFFSSRGQQRLVVLELKLSQISYIKEKKHVKPLLLLDDIFSELDNIHIGHVLGMLPDYQTIITTTHEEFVRGLPAGKVNMIELGKLNNF